MNLNKYLFYSTLATLTIIETLSLAAYHFHSPALQLIGFVIVFLGVLALSLRNIEYGVLVALAELFVSSFGHLFKIEFGAFRMTTRIGIFFAIQIAYNIMLITHFLRGWSKSALPLKIRGSKRGLSAHNFLVRLHEFFQKGLRDSVILTSFFRSPYFYPNLAIFIAIVLGVTVGLVRGNSLQNILRDADAYVVFAYFPIIWAALRSKPSRERLYTIFLASLSWLGFQTALILFVFAHRLREPMSALYVWIRDARIGEITLVAGDFYRVFFQSYIYALIAIFVFATLIIFRSDIPSPLTGEGRVRVAKRQGAFCFFVLCSFLLLVSFSRSFWFGGLVAFIVMLITIRKFSLSLDGRGQGEGGGMYLWRGFLKFIGGVFVALALLFSIVNFPFPPKGPPILLADLFGSRALTLFGEAAAQSRWQLLPEMWKEIKKSPVLGAGFGKTITYKTTDPRALADDPSGLKTTYAFEWGYLDLWLKLGFLGIFAYGWLIFVLLRRGWHSIKKCQMSNVKCQMYGVWLGVISLLAAHFFTPFLNHPLGIGILIVAASLFEPTS